LHDILHAMATPKEALRKWKESRSIWHKVLDIIFWLLLILLILPAPRKVIGTAVNRIALHLKNPGIWSEEKQVMLHDQDYQWVLANSQGTPYYMSDLRGTVIFLNFWATWCPPCIAELPEIQKAYEKYGEKVAFILVANQEPEVVEAFMEKHGYDIPVFYPGTQVPAVFESPSIPTTFIISRDGNIVTRKKGASNWDSRAASHIFSELTK